MTGSSCRKSMIHSICGISKNKVPSLEKSREQRIFPFFPVFFCPAHCIMRSFIKNASAFLPRRAGCEAPSYLRGCDPPCLSMRNNAPVEHCVAEALISDAGLQPMSEPNFTLRIHLMIEITRILRQRLILHRAVLVILIMRYARKVKLVFILFCFTNLRQMPPGPSFRVPSHLRAAQSAS